jgi:serine phosphatase RsbU (regulator of sigma subunit)
MTPKHKKIVLLAFTGLLLFAGVVIIGWRVVTWSQGGWAGMVFKLSQKYEKIEGEEGAIKITFGSGIVDQIVHGSPAYLAGIQQGDEVLEINGIQVSERTELDELAARSKVGDTIIYRVKRGEKEFSIPLRLKTPLKDKQLIISMCISVFVALSFLLIGFFVCWNKPEDARALVFYSMSMVAAAYLFSGSMMQRNLPHPLGLEFSLPGLINFGTTYRSGGLINVGPTEFVLLILFAAILLHFALVFPKERPVVKNHPSITKLIYGLPVLAVLSVQRMADLFVDTQIVLIFVIIVALVSSYRKSGVEEKRQIMWPLWGTVVFALGQLIIFPRIFYLWPYPLWMLREIWKVSYLLIPVPFAIAILKYRLMDIDLIIKKTIIYAILTGIIVALYLSLVGGLGGLLIKFTGIQSTWITIFSTLAIAALFVPVRNHIQNIVDRRFFRKKYDYPTALKNLTRELSQAVELQAMLKLIAEHLQPALQNRSVVIFSRGTYDRAYVAIAKVGLPDEILGQLKFEVDSSLLATMDSPFEVRTQDLPEVEKLTLRKAGSAFIVPVKLKSELVSFISLGTKLSDEDYDAEDKDFLTSVAEQMAAGFDRVRLREQERDFEKAREIQQGLLPKKIPQLPGYEIACAWQPARAVAGDYYDVMKLSESALGICIADIVGKGMPAALLMSNLQAIVRAMTSEDMPPKQLCEKVNRVISSNMTLGKFITFFYCLLDAEKKKLVYTNAGHNRPILFHQDGSWIELKEGGLALGMSRERNYEQGEAELKSGDRLLLFTDGVTEVTNAEGKEFGEERLIELLINNRSLGTAELQKRVMEAVTAFSGGDFQDDVTMVVIGVH